MNFVSLILPVYNVEKYLERCLNSILSQTYSNFELIIIDDGSTDNCHNIINKYKKIDSRIKAFRQENKGLSAARNEGLKKANGEYIGFIDSDDYISKYYIEYLLNALLSNNASISCCTHTEGEESNYFHNEKKEDYKKCIEIYNNRSAGLNMMHGHGIFVTVWGKLYKKEVLQICNFPEGRFGEDNYTSCQYLWNTKNYTDKVILIKKNLYYYFSNPTSIVNTPDKKKIEDDLWAKQQRIIFYTNKNEWELYQLGYKSLENRIFYYMKTYPSKRGYFFYFNYLCYILKIKFNIKTLAKYLLILVSPKLLNFLNRVHNLLKR